MNTLQTWLERVLGLTPELQGQITASLLMLLLLWLVQRMVTATLRRRTVDPAARYRWQKATGYVLFAIGVLIIGRVWFEGFGSIATIIGLVSAGVAIALQEILVSLAGWFFILWRRPFNLGDRIQIGEYTGDVIDIRVFQFSIMEIGNWVAADEPTGRVIHIPNGTIFREPQANFGQVFKYVWHEIPVLLTRESDWKTAKTILQRAISRHSDHLSVIAQRRMRENSERYMVPTARLAPVVYTAVRESGIELTMRYLCEPHERRETEHAIWEELLDAFAAQPGIHFAYPTPREIQSRDPYDVE
jgi:small-conductance mechanosensitive channel